MYVGAATFVVLFVVGLLVVAGLVILVEAVGGPGRSRRRRCPNADCGHRNRPEADFCARCGRRLT